MELLKADKTKVRKSKSFLSKLPKPKIIFKSSEESDSVEISSVLPGTVHKNVSFCVDKQGTLDLNTVPSEFRQMVTQLYANVVQPKFLNDEADDVVTRRGPRVEKGMSEEQVMLIMRSLVSPGSPWDHYRKVIILTCLSFVCLT